MASLVRGERDVAEVALVPDAAVRHAHLLVHRPPARHVPQRHVVAQAARRRERRTALDGNSIHVETFWLEETLKIWL